MPFCVECGREGPTFEGVCADDFRRTHALVRAPEYVDIERCAHCGRVHVGPRWVARSVDEALPGAIAASATTDPHVSSARYATEVRSRTARSAEARTTATCSVGPWELTATFDTRVRIRSGACPTCSRQKGRFFVGTVQVRAEGRPLTDEEAREVQRIAAASPSGEEFLSEVEPVRGGIDLRVSSNAFAKRLAAEIARALGGGVSSSATLHTQREGREQYRATYAVRLLGFRKGDVVLWRRTRYRVVGVGDPVRLENAATGERLRVRPRELRAARVVR